MAEWISVKDRLPEKGDRIIIWLVGPEGDRGPWVITYRGSLLTDVGVHFTHWQPVSAKPEATLVPAADGHQGE